MRLLVRKLHRAFPELDAYSDEQCERFVRAAYRGKRRYLLRGSFLLIYGTVLTLFSSIAGGALGIGIAQIGATGYPPTPPPWLEWPCIALGLIAGAFPALVSVWLLRDWFVRRRVRFVLRTRGNCPGCDYVLIGSPVGENGRITCPECALETTVDPSLGELTIGTGGRRLMPDPSALPNPAPVPVAPDA